jgi:hypothetical protein
MEKMGQLQQQTKKEDISLLTGKPKTGHFYFGKNRTFLLWLDILKIMLENLLKKVQIITVDKKRRIQTIN